MAKENFVMYKIYLFKLKIFVVNFGIFLNSILSEMWLSTSYPIFQNPADKSWRRIYFDKIVLFIHTARMPFIIIGGYEYASKPQMVNVGILKCTYLLHYRKDRILDPLVVFFIFTVQMVPRIFYDSKKIMNALIEFWTKCIFWSKVKPSCKEGIICLRKIRSKYYFRKFHFKINTPRPC